MLQRANGREKARGEFLRLATRTLRAPVERPTIEEASVVVDGKLLLSIKHSEGGEGEARGTWKGVVHKTRPSVKRPERLGCVGTCVLDDSTEVCGGTSCQPSAVANSNRSHTSIRPSAYRR